MRCPGRARAQAPRASPTPGRPSAAARRQSASAAPSHGERTAAGRAGPAIPSPRPDRASAGWGPARWRQRDAARSRSVRALHRCRPGSPRPARQRFDRAARSGRPRPGAPGVPGRADRAHRPQRLRLGHGSAHLPPCRLPTPPGGGGIRPGRARWRRARWRASLRSGTARCRARPRDPASCAPASARWPDGCCRPRA